MAMPLRALTSLLLSLSSTALPLQSTQPNAQIPNLHTTAFSGETVDLPQALHGHVTILIVSFSQDSRDTVTAWFRRLDADYRTSPTVLYYALPDLTGIPGFLRGSILKKIKETVAAPAQPRFLPILTNDEAWKSAVGFNRQTPGQDAYVLLVDGRGTIRFRNPTGPPNDQTYADLKNRLDLLKP